MNIPTKIDEKLWNFISTNYDKRNFTGAILDSIYFLSNIIREKADLESDGVALVGQAFGGKSPKLKVTKLQTETDWNIQSGIEQILRGLFQAIRNPRSHEKFDDLQGDADAIIIFVDFLLKIIDRSKSQFSINQMVQRVYDQDFVQTEEYADLIVAEIPSKKKFETLIEVYNAKEDQYNVNKIKLFFRSLFKSLNEDEKSQFLNFATTELNITDDYATITLLTSICKEQWDKIAKVTKLRIENKFIKALDNARYFPNKKQYNKEGAFFTWITNIIDHFILKKELINSLENFFETSDNGKIDFFLKYGFDILTNLKDVPDFLLEFSIKKNWILVTNVFTTS